MPCKAGAGVKKEAVCEMTRAGRNVYVRIFCPRKRQPKGQPRGQKSEPTTLAMRIQNDRNAARHLAILIDINFGIGDLHAQLTYRGDPPTEAEARKCLEAFLRRLRKLYRRRGAPFRYIVVTEYEATRIHHHILLPRDCREGVTFDEIEKEWGRGSCFRRPMYTSTLHALAGYLVKETSKTFRKEGSAFKRRYSAGGDISRPPDPDKVLVGEDELLSPRVPKGFEICEDTWSEGENPFTGRRYIEFVLVPKAPAAKYRRRPGSWKARGTPTGEAGWLKQKDSGPGKVATVSVENLFEGGEDCHG